MPRAGGWSLLGWRDPVWALKVSHHPPEVWSFLRMEAERLESCPGLGDAWPRPGGAAEPGESPWEERGHSPRVSPRQGPEGRNGDGLTGR